jgi:hypothetical protein
MASMRFADSLLNDALDLWAKDPDLRQRACAHNIAFDERLAGSRGDFFEAMTTGFGIAPDGLRRRAIDYYRDYVRVSRGIPHTFLDLNASAGITAVARDLDLIRIEDLRDPLDKTGVDAVRLADAIGKHDKTSRALLDWFCEQWNTRPDIRRNPRCFSALKDECLFEISASDWPELLRNKFGLDHFDGSRSGPIFVALMEFTAGDVLDEAATIAGLKFAFSIPTALDSDPNLNSSQHRPQPDSVPAPSNLVVPWHFSS